MSLPEENKLSSKSAPMNFLVRLRNEQLIDYEWGGSDLQNPQEGLRIKIWRCFYEGKKIKITDGNLIYSLINVDAVTAVGLAFDFNMNPNVVYIADGKTYFWWYDTVAHKHITTEYGAEFISPQISLDDHRLHQSASADIIFAYIRNAKLCYRQQRDRYQIEYVLGDAKNQKLTQIGMSKNYRFQFRTVFDWRNE
ncbi:hypothetical protein [Acinetobacter sp. WCHAc060007]|uniref:hypothetical protein n=1 Tax=Acinetobacter sp. WCHAc060007 TaxID=2419605 RepID=UPI000EA3D469|nr:hypothetical protein [Acinetobacter sp. WCHAc060007]RKG44856.1 hypothetical protein D7V31_01280 [Acinetobacter sp. WCHAc060007]